jgi:hypothetical protein
MDILLMADIAGDGGDEAVMLRNMLLGTWRTTFGSMFGT